MTRWNLVVAGVDGSPLSRRALRWAFELADFRRSQVLAVSSWEPPMLGDLAARQPNRTGADPAAMTRARASLAQAVGELTGDLPTVTVRQRLLTGPPGLELVKLSEHADLVVVGAQGHQALSGMLLGSVSQYVLAHSTCTVTVVR